MSSLFEYRSLDSLRSERKRLMYDVDCIERGETLCIARAYIKLLTRLYMVDIAIGRIEHQNVMEMRNDGQ